MCRLRVGLSTGLLAEPILLLFWAGQGMKASPKDERLSGVQAGCGSEGHWPCLVDSRSHGAGPALGWRLPVKFLCLDYC